MSVNAPGPKGLPVSSAGLVCAGKGQLWRGEQEAMGEDEGLYGWTNGGSRSAMPYAKTDRNEWWKLLPDDVQQNISVFPSPPDRAKEDDTAIYPDSAERIGELLLGSWRLLPRIFVVFTPPVCTVYP